jgi:hypothetical protein
MFKEGREIQFHTQLNNARIVGRVDAAEDTGIHKRLHATERSVIESVKELRSELGAHPLPDFGVLNRGKIPVVKAGTVDHPATRIAEMASGRISN